MPLVSIFRGLVSFFRSLARIVLSSLAILLGAAIALGEADVNIDLGAIRLPWLAVLYALFGTLLLTAFALRGRLLEARWAYLLARMTGKTRPKLADFTQSAVSHILVATDLLSGRPVFFGRENVYCEPYGWAQSETTSTATALYASAAFPIVFPPRKLSTRRLDFRIGDEPGPKPKRLKLADGGIYNNLGNDWHRVRSDHAQRLWTQFDRAERETHLVIVNASAPSKALPRRGMYPGWTAIRIMSVLYDNTVRPRVALAESDKAMLIDIGESPIELARRLTTHDDADVMRRASDMAGVLEGMPDDYWSSLKAETSSTPTKLSRAGREPAAMLMHHGYLSALVLLYVHFGHRLPGFKKEWLEATAPHAEAAVRDSAAIEAPPKPLDEGYFLDLVGPKPLTVSQRVRTAFVGATEDSGTQGPTSDAGDSEEPQ